MKTGKRWSRRVVRLASAAAMLASLEGLRLAEGAQTVGATQAILSGSPKGDGEVPFTVQDGYLIIVEARIGGQRRVRLALDTGATQSVLRSDLVKGPKFGHRWVRIVNLDHALTQEVVEVADFQLGPLRIHQLPMMVNDLSYLRQTAPGMDGVIGLDVLRLRSFSIDFGRRKITFGAPRRVLRSSAAMEMDQSYLAVEVRMLERPLRLIVDTGVRSILLYRDRIGDRLPNMKIEQEIRGASLSGSASLEVVTLPQLQLNGTELQRRAVLLRNSPAGFLPGVDGYLSPAALGAWRLSFDFERNLLSWE
jgi:hypothetical protein